MPTIAVHCCCGGVGIDGAKEVVCACVADNGALVVAICGVGGLVGGEDATHSYGWVAVLVEAAEEGAGEAWWAGGKLIREFEETTGIADY